MTLSGVAVHPNGGDPSYNRGGRQDATHGFDTQFTYIYIHIYIKMFVYVHMPYMHIYTSVTCNVLVRVCRRDCLTTGSPCSNCVSPDRRSAHAQCAVSPQALVLETPGPKRVTKA